MLSLDTVRAAALSDQPWTRLDELVRAEMATGRKVNDIADDFARMADTVWDTPGLSDDGHNAFGDTYDALTGNCHRDCCYYDPPTLPTEEEIAELPRWARVAFASRVARHTVTANYESRGTPAFAKAIHSAVLLAEQSAAIAGTSTGVYFQVSQVLSDELARADARLLDVFSPVFHTAFAVLSTVPGGVVNEHARNHLFSLPQRHQVIEKVRRDFDHLARLAKWQHWTDHIPVPPEVFGPLWPEGPPPGWPADPDVPARSELSFDLLVRDGVADGITEDETVNLFHAVNAYYIARTGDRLTLDGYKALIAALTPAGV